MFFLKNLISRKINKKVMILFWRHKFDKGVRFNLSTQSQVGGLESITNFIFIRFYIKSEV